MVTPAARREAVAHLEESLEVSERRACSIIAADRSAVRYRRPSLCAALRPLLGCLGQPSRSVRLAPERGGEAGDLGELGREVEGEL
jgi:hypothetical protein